MPSSERIKFFLSGISIIIALTASIVGLTFGLRVGPKKDGGSPVDPIGPPSVYKEYKTAIVASDTIACSTVGKNILLKGGSATDAAIATMFCVGVVQPHSSGIGGGHFTTIFDRRKTSPPDSAPILQSILSRERAPLDSDKDMFVNKTLLSKKGGLAIAVPGEIKGFSTAWEEFGKLPWKDLVQPTIDMLDKGVVVESNLAKVLRDNELRIRLNPGLSDLFIKPNGEIMKFGDRYRNDKLKNTLEKISQDKNDFYTGSLATDIVEDIKDAAGIIKLQDLNDYVSKTKQPLNLRLENAHLNVYGPSPPSSGVIYQYILNILDGYKFKKDDLKTEKSKADVYHKIIEAFKFAYAKRSNLGDEDYVDVAQLVRNLTSLDYGSYIRSRITNDRTHPISYYEPDFDIVNDAGTAHVSIIKNDTAVGLTSTINLYFGSDIVGVRTGIIFNDEMDDFSTPGTINSFGVPASPNNYIVPKKMPMSSMCPAIILNDDREIVYVTGASGGTRITTAVAWTTLHSLWFEKRIDRSLDEPRLHHQLVPDDLVLERNVSNETATRLAEKGHNIRMLQGRQGVVQGAHRICKDSDKKCITGASDGRKGGAPDGF